MKSFEIGRRKFEADPTMGWWSSIEFDGGAKF
jgi:hypothetical protein